MKQDFYCLILDNHIIWGITENHTAIHLGKVSLLLFLDFLLDSLPIDLAALGV